MKQNEMIFSYRGNEYPDYIKRGNACSFIIPYAKEFCQGNGLDIGGYFDWTFPGARAINTVYNDGFDAYKLPEGEFDYIFSSHTLEHLPNYVEALEYWKSKLLVGGSLFLYLPHPDMEYWLPQNNRKHLHIFRPEELTKILRDLGFSKVLHSERDLYWSFAVVAIK